MKLRLSFILFITFGIIFPSLAQDTEKVKVGIIVVDKIDGSSIKNPYITVSYLLSENVVLPKTDKKGTFYELIKGAEIKVRVTAVGYYEETEVFDTDNLYNEDHLALRLSPKNMASVMVTVVDDVSKKPIPANVQISFKGLNSIQNTTPEKKQVEFSYEQAGIYSFKASSPGYENMEISQQLEADTKSDKVKTIVIPLRKLLFTQKITFKNKNDNSIIPPPFLVEILNVSDKSKTTIWNKTKEEFEYTTGDTYNITVIKDGFKTLFQQIKPNENHLDLFLEPNILPGLLVEVKEMATQLKIKQDVQVKSPSGKITTVPSNTRFQASEQGEYQFSFNHPGFGQFSKNVLVGYMTSEKVENVSFEIPQVSEIKLIVLDSLTNQPISNFTSKIINTSNNNEVKASKSANILSLKKAPLLEYTFHIDAKGYHSKNGKILAAQVTMNTITVLMSQPFEYEEHEFVFKDDRTGEVLKKTQLLIIGSENQPVETLYNQARGTYLTSKMVKGKNYTIEGKAEGYKNINTAFKNEGREIVLNMSPASMREIIVTVLDEYTREMLILNSPKFTLQGGAALSYRERNREYVINVSNTDKVILDFKQTGYPDFSNLITLNNIQNDRLEILMKKAAYPLKLKIKNDLTESQKDNALAKINYLDGTVVKNQFLKDENTFNLVSDPNEILQVEINVPGFKTYKASNNRQQLAMFEIEVLLEPVPVPVAEVAVEKPKEPETPLKSPELQTKTEETPTKLPETTPKPEINEPMLAQKGKRYRLDGVNFEQSKTTMLYGSELKLNELLQFMNENPKVKIEITGHTDNTGDSRQNQRLSEFRARTVANWLFNRGIEPDRIVTLGKGSSEPVAPNGTEDDKAKNRRIEVLVIED